LIRVFFTMLCCGVMAAHAETEVVVVGAHISGQNLQLAEQAAAKLVSAVDRQRGLKAIPPEVVRSRIRGRGEQILDDALTGKGTALLAEGKILFEQADLETALIRLAGSIAALEGAMAGTTDSRGLVDALLLVGMAQLSMGQPDAARMMYKRVLLLDPTRELDTIHYPPKVVALFSEVRSAVLAAPRASITITTTPLGASVFVDGRLRGQSPVKVGDLIPGVHHILVTSDAGFRHYEVIQVAPKSKTTVVATLENYFVGRAMATRPARSEQIGELYRALGDRVTGGLVLVAGEIDPDTVGMQLFEPRTGNYSRVLTAPAGGDPAGALVGLAPQVGAFLNKSGVLGADQVGGRALSLDIETNPLLAQVLLDDRRRPASPPSEPSSPAPTARGDGIPWYIWAGVGVMAVGAAGAAFALQGDGPEGEGGGGKDGGETTTGSTGTIVVVTPN